MSVCSLLLALPFTLIRYGPKPSTRHKYEYSESCELSCHIKFAPFAFRASTAPEASNPHALAEDERQVSLVVQQALASAVDLNRYPKSSLEVHIQVLEADGGTLGAAITTASLALADAGVSLFDLTPACEVVSIVYTRVSQCRPTLVLGCWKIFPWLLHFFLSFP